MANGDKERSRVGKIPQNVYLGLRVGILRIQAYVLKRSLLALMNQPKLLELAKQGDVKAIASVLNYLLQDKGITAKAHLKDGGLQIMLESAQVPKQESSVALIHKAILKLEVQSLKSVKIYGKQIGQDFPVWTELITLTDKGEETKKQSNQNTDNNLWPIGFPSLNSWLRTFALVLWGAIVVRIAGFWGIVLGGILSLVAEHPGPLLWFLGLALIASVLVFSYAHHILFGQSSSPSARWIPSRMSLWEGVYAPIVMILSLLIPLIIIIPFSPIATCNYVVNERLQECLELSDRAISFYLEKYHIEKIAAAIFLFSAAYLYQIEYSIRKHFVRKRKTASNSTISNKSIDNSDIELDRLRGQMGLTQVKKGSAHPQKIIPETQNLQRKTKNLPKALLILLLIVLGAAGNYGLAQLPQFQQAISLPIASQTSSPMPSTPIAIAPSQTTSEVPVQPPQADPFQQAVNNAMSAAKLTQTAKSKEDWNTIASQWQEAIALMKAVPTSHLNYGVAQKKAVEYQRNLDYARLAISRSK